MLKNIVYSFPKGTSESTEFFKCLELMLEKLPNFKKTGGITLSSIHPQGAFPVTSFQQDDVPFPQILFETQEDFVVKINNFYLRSAQKTFRPEDSARPHADKEIKKDFHGDYVELTINKLNIINCLSRSFIKESPTT
ncbi:hypothetical protein A3G67_01405 [Candidatus Roizmanbacteria bacterium RIFCSPLOWO2_12_FULL_40_12]|uniref:Uncharacterized protein n=1 Tax=Candidatus Roizmanbacteria bacterium RIFCSPLOWO2_01_FULL_40_42 TaxID=1802066 RepID=A0A1F7J471_9BACT|nr:MAG: hypothetical protein A2779_00075 [Candidatus Roizmanbacteria bacterium RIFCSPHIGHO2_01_FULL_40_98]OGK28491.1 MAG: hypothetical protein A3C31_02850 [Candidatus Roizmanbacteria bacterium RIFCSPHIGHO2_02_FULL_40_53]OGK29382.1 MAG: hypothetical protein A2W49_00600 [Candidatus Roizmanbacteria bacterium RIFCSPHIGHO2_12_41_18]OGK36523.1 MAG: hypothetical protein A3E69_03065 [Candidatus Roizmanbacteria bacterium RIFCSPHIGHO2_12_FULL_40_130]OGK50408.1 MAG: hypothetical protein A3B50_04630 [Candi